MAKRYKLEGRDQVHFDRLWLWGAGAVTPMHAEYIRVAKEVGATDICVLINDKPKGRPWFVNPTPKHLVNLTLKARAAGLGIHWCTWLDTREEYVKDAAAGLRKMMDDAQPDSICFDVEEDWQRETPTLADGTKTTHEEFVTRVIAPQFANWPTPIGVTSLGILPGNVIPLLLYCLEQHDGYGAAQIYPVHIEGAAWTESPLIRADVLPVVVVDSWTRVMDVSQFQGILAAYRDVHPGWTPQRALQTLLEAMEHLGVRHIGLWSVAALRKDNSASRQRRQALARVRLTGDAMPSGMSIWGRAKELALPVLGTLGALGGGLFLWRRYGARG